MWHASPTHHRWCDRGDGELRRHRRRRHHPQKVATEVRPLRRKTCPQLVAAPHILNGHIPEVGKLDRLDPEPPKVGLAPEAAKDEQRCPGTASGAGVKNIQVAGSKPRGRRTLEYDAWNMTSSSRRCDGSEPPASSQGLEGLLGRPARPPSARPRAGRRSRSRCCRRCGFLLVHRRSS